MASLAKCALLLAVLQHAASTAIPVDTCAPLHQILHLKNITIRVPDKPLNGSGLCGTGVSCCSREMEATLQQTVTRELHSLLHHKFQTIHGMLATTAQALQEHVRRLARESENKTMGVLEEVYRRMWREVRGPVGELYEGLVGYVEGAGGEEKSSIERRVLTFFQEIFPAVYQEAVLHLDGAELSGEYRACLVESMERVEPFGEYPGQVSGEVGRSFHPTSLLVQALRLGLQVLDSTDRLMSENPDSCREALVRLYYCPRCLGLPSAVKPCNGYCLNVMRGCLTQQRTTELDLPWSNFLQETERLVHRIHSGPGIEHLLATLPSTISDAIMYATMNGPALEKKVKKSCGSPKLLTKEGVSTTMATREEVTSPRGVPTSASWEHEDKTELQLQLEAFLESSNKARGFYANLAEALCSDESFAETRDTADCWNGHRVGEYTKALVRPGVDAQKYNPELKWTEVAPDPSIRQLSDKLRHMRQVVLTEVGQGWRRLESDSLVREGSGGSGAGAIGWSPEDDEPDHDYADQGSGSGAGIYKGPKIMREPVNHINHMEETQGSGKKTSNSPKIKHSSHLIVATSVLLVFARWSH